MAKITTAQRTEMQRLFVDEGWHIQHLARYYNITHTGVIRYTQGLKRKAPIINYCPDEVVAASAHVQSWKQNRPREFKTYEDYLEADEKRRMKKREACGHGKLVIICTCCGQHFEETPMQKAKAKVVFI